MDKAAVLDLGAVRFEQQLVLDIRAMELIKWNELRARETGAKGERKRQTARETETERVGGWREGYCGLRLSLIHISEPTRPP